CSATVPSERRAANRPSPAPPTGLCAGDPRARVAPRRRAARRARLGGLAHRVDDGLTTVTAVVAGVWLVAKDWRDLFPARRDTAAWRLGLHVHVHPPPGVRRPPPLLTL